MYLTANDMPDTLISVIPKCGSQSIQQVMQAKTGCLNVRADDSLAYANRVAFIRNPLDRLESCWSFFRSLRLNGYPLKEFLPRDVIAGEKGKEQEEYETFIDHILKNNDPHWDSQVDLLTNSNGVFTPTSLHRFEDIKLHWEKYAVGALPWNNAYSKVVHDPYRADDIAAKYAADMTLWETL